MIIKNTQFEAQHPWPADVFIQGGTSGVVFRAEEDGGVYGTAFVEAFTEDMFVRGEGEDVAEAETACWTRYQHYEGCPGHEYEPRHYKNGGGICIHCKRFKSKVFTPEQLGLFCAVCEVPTFYARRNDEFYCEDHAQTPDSMWLEARQANGLPNTTGGILSDMFAKLTARADEEEAEVLEELLRNLPKDS